LAIEGPKASNPSTYIRFIYNRINLERAVIRAAAVSALAAFANGVASLKKSILLLLRNCLDDSDDEVRERAYFYIVLIEQSMNTTVLGESLQLEDKASNVDDFEELKDFVFDHENNINVDALEAYLNANKDELMEQEDEINIDISTMMVKGALDKSIDSGIGSTASEVSSNAQSTQNQASSNNQAPSSTQ
jgi:coatomer protein complex subunit gamma